MAVAGAATTAVAQQQQAQQQQDVAKYNAKIATNQATATQYAADVQAKQRADRTRRLLASQRVAIGASGISTEGSPLAVMMDSAAQGAYEQGLIRYGGNRGAEALQGEAGLQRFYGDQASTAGDFRAGTTLLSGAGQGASAYARYQASSVPGPPTTPAPGAY